VHRTARVFSGYGNAKAEDFGKPRRKKAEFQDRLRGNTSIREDREPDHCNEAIPKKLVMLTSAGRED